MAAESEVSFSDDLDGSTIRVGVLRTRWNDEHVSNLVDGIKVSFLVLFIDSLVDNIIFVTVIKATYHTHV